MYQIKRYSFERAKDLVVKILPSKNGKYKIDVFTQDGEYITSIGHKDYSDFPTYMQDVGEEYANRRRDLYWKRHEKDTGVRGFYAKKLLW